MENKEVFVFKNGKTKDMYTVFNINTGEEEDVDEFILLNARNGKLPDGKLEGVFGLILDNTNNSLIDYIVNTRNWDCLHYSKGKLFTAFDEYAAQSKEGLGMVWFRGEKVIHNRSFANRVLDFDYQEMFYAPHVPERSRARPLEEPEEDELEDIAEWTEDTNDEDI